MRDYISDMIECITTGNEKHDMETIEELAITIAAQKNVTKDQAKEMLLGLRSEYYE